MNTNWTLDHWINLGLFVASTLLVGLSSLASWHDVWAALTPGNVGGFGLGLVAFFRTMYTNKPRDPNVGERRSDPNPTAPVVQVGPNTVVPVPPVTAGRPVDPTKE